MSKLKILFGLALIAASLAATAAPAAAWFEATNGSSGESTVKLAGKTTATLVFAFKGGTAECEIANTMVESWKIQEPTEKPGKVFFQKQVKTGPDEIVVLSCKEGKIVLGGVKVSIALEKCPVHVEQPLKGAKTEGHGAMVVECLLNIPADNCSFKIPMGKETTGENLMLQTIEQENSLAGNTFFKFAVEKIHYTSNCPIVTSPGEAKMTGAGELFGQKVI